MPIGIYKRTKEHNKKLSEARLRRKKRLGYINSPETREKLRRINLGKRHSEEAKRKVGAAHKGKPLSKEHRKKLSEAKRGKKCYLWKGGISPLVARVRECFKSRQWRSDVYTRDSFTCQGCGDSSGGNLEAHHIKSFSSIFGEYQIKTFEQAIVCEELWNINNGLTLCKRCHEIKHKAEREEIKNKKRRGE